MHRAIILGTVGAVYYGLSAYALHSFEVGVVVTAMILFAFPAAFLAHFSYAPSAVLITVATFGLGLALLLEGTAHIYGLWYTVGVDTARLFGMIPLEVLIMTVSQVVFYALLYEMMFDDGTYTPHSARVRFTTIGVFVIAVLVLLAAHQYVFKTLFIESSYLWIVATILFSALAALGVHRTYSARFFDRLLNFALVGAIPGMIALWLAVTHTHKVFAHSTVYLAEFRLFGASFPLEEMLLVFAIPLLVATVYEIYLDDAQ